MWRKKRKQRKEEALSRRRVEAFVFSSFCDKTMLPPTGVSESPFLCVLNHRQMLFVVASLHFARDWENKQMENCSCDVFVSCLLAASCSSLCTQKDGWQSLVFLSPTFLIHFSQPLFFIRWACRLRKKYCSRLAPKHDRRNACSAKCCSWQGRPLVGPWHPNRLIFGFGFLLLALPSSSWFALSYASEHWKQVKKKKERWGQSQFPKKESTLDREKGARSRTH